MALEEAIYRRLAGLVRSIPDYPKAGIMFRDITPLLADREGFLHVITALSAPFRDLGIDYVVGIEARGFILGGGVARCLDCGFVPIRKAGKLPAETVGEDYDLEYGTDRVEIHKDAFVRGARLLLIDDVIATGGTAHASVRLLERMGGELCGFSCIIDLPDIGGVRLLEAHPVRVHRLMSFRI